MNHPTHIAAKTFAPKKGLVPLLAAASFAAATVICSVGYAQAQAGRMVELSIEGMSFQQAAPGAAVSASVGGQQFSTQADAKGHYRLQLRVPVAELAQMVQLSAQAAGRAPGSGWVSRPGSVESLIAQAGADGVLNQSENARVQINTVSSAEAALVVDALGYAPRTADEQAKALQAVDEAQLLDLAGTLQLMATHPEQNPLPVGAVGVQDFLANRTLRVEAVESLKTQGPDLLAQASEAVVASLSASTLTVATASDGRFETVTGTPVRFETSAWADTNADGEADAEVREVHKAIDARISDLGNGMAVLSTRRSVSHPGQAAIAARTEISLKPVRLAQPEVLVTMAALSQPTGPSGGLLAQLQAQGSSVAGWLKAVVQG